MAQKKTVALMFQNRRSTVFFVMYIILKSRTLVDISTAEW